MIYSLPSFEPFHCSMFGSNCSFLTQIQASQETSKVVWYFHLFKKFPQFVVIHIVKGFSIINEAELDIFWNYIALSVIHLSGCWQFYLWFFSLIENTACTSRSSLFTYCWSLAWSILTITLLVCEIRLFYSLNTVSHRPPLGLEWKLKFSSPAATVKFSKFDDILRVVL